MRKFNIHFIVSIIGLLWVQSALAVQFIHNEPAPVLLGETIQLELTYTDTQQPVSNVVLFYRMQGESNFRSLRMRQEGMLLISEINSAKLYPGNLQYYFAYQDSYGGVNYLPATSPEQNPFQLKILPAKSDISASGDSLFMPLLLTPNPGDVVESDELLIAFSIPFELNPDELSYKLFIGGVDVTRVMTREGNLLSFSPKTIRSGLHNAELKIFNSNGKIVGQNQVSFRVSGKPSKQKGFDSNTRIFFDNRYRNIQETSDNSYRGGVRFNGSYKKFDIRAHALISSEENYSGQPVNQFAAQVSYIFNERNAIYFKAGDFSTNYDQLSFWEKRIRGIGVGFRTSYFDFDYSTGQNFKAVKGAIDTSGTISRYGTYEQSFTSFRPQFNFGRHFSWAFNLVNSKDDPNSADYAANAKEALVVGSSMALNLHKKRIIFKGSFQGSIQNVNAGADKIDFDSLANDYNLEGSERDQAESFVNFLDKTNFLSLTEGLSPFPSIAMQFETQIRYFGQDLRATYKRIDGNFTSPGNPYLQKDIAGFYISDNIRLLENQVLLNLYYNAFAENLSKDDAKTNNRSLGGSISYFPFSKLPSITLSYGNQTRNNNITDTSSTVMNMEDNRHQRFGVSSSYNFNTANIRNTIMFNASKFQHTDEIYQDRESDLVLFSVGIRNRFEFPLTTKLNYSQSGTNIGGGSTKTNTDIQTIQFSTDYTIKKFWQQSELKPYLNIRIQNITNDSQLTASGDSQRRNYSAGFYLRNTGFGNVSFRYDFIDYGDTYDWKDTIISARYDYAF